MLIALAALAIALLVSFFIGGDDSAVVEEATIIEEPAETDAVVVDADPVAPVEDDANLEVVNTDEPLAPEATETVPLGEPVQADGEGVIETDAATTDTAAAPATDEPLATEAEATDTATTPLATEATGTDTTETGSIEAGETDAAVTVLPADGEAPATEGIEFETVPVQQ